jgi:hypothetical protein
LKTDSYAPDESFVIEHCASSVSAVGYTVTEFFVLGDHHSVGSHSGCLFAKLIFDKITIHPGLGPDPDLAQLDVIPSRPALDEHHVIRMGSGEMRRARIKPGAGIGAAGGNPYNQDKECTRYRKIFSHFRPPFSMIFTPPLF